MPWFVLVVAGLLEVGWASLLPSVGRRALETVAFVLFMAGSVAGLTYAARSVPVGTAYAVWMGVGVVGTVVVGILLRDEPAGVARLLALAALLVALVAVKATSP